MGLRKFSLRAFMKKNFDFIAGIFSEISFAAMIMGVAFAICVLLALIKSAI